MTTIYVNCKPSTDRRHCCDLLPYRIDPRCREILQGTSLARLQTTLPISLRHRQSMYIA